MFKKILLILFVLGVILLALSMLFDGTTLGVIGIVLVLPGGIYFLWKLVEALT